VFLIFHHTCLTEEYAKVILANRDYRWFKVQSIMGLIGFTLDSIISVIRHIGCLVLSVCGSVRVKQSDRHFGELYLIHFCHCDLSIK
jgi:hypothetical protein